MRLVLRMLTGVALISALTLSHAVAKEVRIVIGTAGDGALHRGMDHFAQKIEEKTNGEYTGKVFKGSLLSFGETPKGVTNGVAEVGYVVPAYVRGEFPLSNYATDITSTIVEPLAVGAAMSEFIFTCEPCLEEYKRQNQVFMGFSVVGPYKLMSTKKIEGASDIQGMKIRGFGAFNGLIKNLGATSVTLTANEVYEGFSQGQLDGNIHLWDLIKTLSLGDYVDYMYDHPIGIYGGNSMFNTNRDFWNTLSDKDKRKFMEAAAEALAFTTVNYFVGEATLAGKGDELGVTASETPADVREAIESFQKQNIQNVIDTAVEKGDIADARAHAERLLQLLDKWRGLMKEVPADDAEAVAKVYKEELFGKVDLSTLQ